MHVFNSIPRPSKHVKRKKRKRKLSLLKRNLKQKTYLRHALQLLFPQLFRKIPRVFRLFP